AASAAAATRVAAVPAGPTRPRCRRCTVPLTTADNARPLSLQEVVAEIAEEVADDVAFGEAPGGLLPPALSLEAVVIPPSDDGLKGQIWRGLEDGEVRARLRRGGLLVHLDDEVGCQVLGLRGAC